MESWVENSADRTILKLSGDLAIQNADRFKLLLEEILDATDSLVINIESVTEIDLSCLQLFCAAHRTSARLSKALEIEQCYPAVIKETLNKTGYARNAGCHSDMKSQCLAGSVTKSFEPDSLTPALRRVLG